MFRRLKYHFEPFNCKNGRYNQFEKNTTCAMIKCKYQQDVTPKLFVTVSEYIYSCMSGADPAILKRGVPTLICPHSYALIVQKKGVATPGTLPLDPPLYVLIC